MSVGSAFGRSGYAGVDGGRGPRREAEGRFVMVNGWYAIDHGKCRMNKLSKYHVN